MPSYETMSNRRAPQQGEAGCLREGYDAATDLVVRQPALSLLVVAGVGFGLGLLLGCALAEPPRDERSAMARLGRNMLDAMGRYVPDSVSKHFNG